MSLEEQLAANTEALKALTAALKAGGGVAAGKVAASGGASGGYKPKHSVTEMQKLMEELKVMDVPGEEKGGLAAAKIIIRDVGKAGKLAEVSDPKVIDAIYEAAAAKIEEIRKASESGDDI